MMVRKLEMIGFAMLLVLLRAGCAQEEKQDLKGQDKEQDMLIDISQDLSPIEFGLEVKGLADWVHPKQYKNPGVIPLAPGEPLELQLSAVNSSQDPQKAKVVVADFLDFLCFFPGKFPSTTPPPPCSPVHKPETMYPPNRDST